MARQVKLFLIRHGETVDNVAQVYAGTRDSVLTNQGVQQATRLGIHFEKLGLRFTHLFSSPLQRAAKTAGLVRDAQVASSVDGLQQVPDIVQLPELMEQDFGSSEGKKWHARPVDDKALRPDGFVDVESKQSLARRADAFLDGHILPLLDDVAGPPRLEVAIVSHGILLSSLWKRLLARLPQKSVSISPVLTGKPLISLEHLGGWSNTGYLEVHLSQTLSKPRLPGEEIDVALSTRNSLEDQPHLTAADNAAGAPSQVPLVRESLMKLGADWSMTIQVINGKDHLRGLKRTGGGVGSSAHDASQKTIDSFFKRRRC